MTQFKKVSNPPNRFARTIVEWLDEPPDVELEVYEEEAKTIIAKNDSPDIGFTYSINPYRGCFHACAYCYARPGHQFLDMGAGTDFERKIVAKVNAPKLLREAFMKSSWKGDGIAFSGVTDCYQPLEATYELTRGCLTVCSEFRNPVILITKGALVRRDVDILSDLSKNASASVAFSIAFHDDQVSRKVEPSAPLPSIRFAAMEKLAKAGIEVGVGIAPVIPGLNDSHIPEILRRARDAGASYAFMTLLRLPAEVRTVFTERIEQEFPDRSKKIFAQLKELRGGVLYKSEFGERMHGQGPRWEAIEYLFRAAKEKLGYPASEERRKPAASTFQRPGTQLSFGFGSGHS